MSSIPIQNIYYLLSYAWNKLDEKELIKVSLDSDTKLQDLFAKVLINGTKILLKRGILKNYREQIEELSGIRGKLELADTMKKGLLIKRRSICNFDEYTPDILFNQILYSTLLNIKHLDGLDPILKADIKQVLRYFPSITFLRLYKRHFSSWQRRSGSNLNRFLFDVCELVFNNLLPSEQAGSVVFRDFTRDDNQMNKLFESFVRRFYQVNLGVGYNVGAQDINWKLKPIEAGGDYLPKMRTDITIENADKIIIDAKFYSETMNVYYDKEKIKSANLYQLFAYLINQEDETESSKRAVGILLYPTIEEEYNLLYRYNEHNVYIKTVNLNASWREIDRRLKDIVRVKFGS